MKSIILIVTVPLFIIGCGLANSKYVTKNFYFNTEKSVTVGSSMIILEAGVKNDVYNKVLSGITQELIYGGIDGNTIQVDYREYSTTQQGSMARPAFSQSVKYDISKSKIITFRSIEIEVIEANSREIIFKVLKMDLAPEYKDVKWSTE